MSTIETVVKYYNHFGVEIEYTQEHWETYYTGAMREYIGSAIQNNDIVMFHGNMDQGSLTVNDRSETVYDSYWVTEEVEVLTQQERADMYFADVYEFSDFED